MIGNHIIMRLLDIHVITVRITQDTALGKGVWNNRQVINNIWKGYLVLSRQMSHMSIPLVKKLVWDALTEIICNKTCDPDTKPRYMHTFISRDVQSFPPFPPEAEYLIRRILLNDILFGLCYIAFCIFRCTFRSRLKLRLHAPKARIVSGGQMSLYFSHSRQAV